MEDWAKQNTRHYEFLTKTNQFHSYRGPVFEVNLTFLEPYTSEPHKTESGYHGHTRQSLRSMGEAFYRVIEPCSVCLPETAARSVAFRTSHKLHLEDAYLWLHSWAQGINFNYGMISGPPISVKESQVRFSHALKELERISYAPRDLEFRAAELQKAYDDGDIKLVTIIEHELLDLAI